MLKLTGSKGEEARERSTQIDRQTDRHRLVDTERGVSILTRSDLRTGARRRLYITSLALPLHNFGEQLFFFCCSTDTLVFLLWGLFLYFL